jgi:hypothetical protein
MFGDEKRLSEMATALLEAGPDGAVVLSLPHAATARRLANAKTFRLLIV